MNQCEGLSYSDDDIEMRPRRQSLFGVLRRDGNWKCFILTAILMACVATAIWCITSKTDEEKFDYNSLPPKRLNWKFPCDIGNPNIPMGFMLLIYFFFLVECYKSNVRKLLSKKIDISHVTARIESMMNAKPRVWWKATCYHYERRKRPVTRYRNGDPYQTTQAYYERVNTHTASTTFSHVCCGQKDASRNLVLDNRKLIIKIRFSKEFAFANNDSAREFEEQRSRFFAQHEMFDEYMERKEGLELLGINVFKENMVAYRGVDQWSWYSSLIFFWAASCLMLSWPLRILIEYNTEYVHYKIKKIFGTNYELDPSRQTDLDTHLSDTLPPVTASNYDWVQHNDEQSPVLGLTPRPHRILPLSTASTVDSLELFAAIRENCALVPSYSEAVGIDAALQNNTEENNIEDRSLIATEPPRALATLDEPTPRPNTLLIAAHSNSDIATSSNEENRSGINSQQVMNRTRTDRRFDYRSIFIDPEPHCSTTHARTLFYPRELSPTCSRDPFRGRQETTPTDEPPSYEEAIRLPTVPNITRSNSGTEIAGPRRAFLRDVMINRMSGLEGVGALSDAQVVRIPLHGPGEETAV